MIDTVKLSLRIHPDVFADNKSFQGFSSEYLGAKGFYSKLTINTPKGNHNSGDYLPRITLYKRPMNGVLNYQLFAEFSAPKILYGNNLEELDDTDFDKLILKLQEKLKQLCGYEFTFDSLRTAPVSAWHPSKNIIFRDYTSCQVILDLLSKQDVSLVYDIQRTTYRTGHSLQIHSNTLELCFYDKIAELHDSMISTKRSVEPYASKQKEILESIKDVRPLSIFRYEVRLSSRTRIKSEYPSLSKWNFEELYSSELSKSLLIKHWRKLTKNINLLSLDPNLPKEIFENCLINDASLSATEALKETACLLIINQGGYRSLQQLITKHGGVHTWYRLKPKIRTPAATRYKFIKIIGESLDVLQPIKLSELK